VCSGEWSSRDSDDCLLAIALEAFVDGDASRTVYAHLDGAREEAFAFHVPWDDARVLYEQIFWSAGVACNGV